MFVRSLIALTIGAMACLAAPMDTLSNGERFRRGLPPKSPLKRFNATGTTSPISRRSNAAQTILIQASPSPQARRKRSDPIYDEVSYLFYDSTSANAFRFTADESSATRFTVAAGSTGTGQTLTFVSGSTTYSLCSMDYYDRGTNARIMYNNGAAGTSVYFGACTGTQTTAAAVGAANQLPIWTLPNSYPGTVAMTYYSYDGTTQSPPFYYFTSTWVSSQVDMFGAAIHLADFGSGISGQTPYLLQYVLAPVG